MIDKIVKNGLCLGCGLCSSVLGEKECKMKLFKNGFNYPVVDKNKDDHIIRELCPGIRVHDYKKHGLWGHVEKVAEAWSKDSYLRFKSASGGVSSALALYLIEKHIVDGILQVGVKDNSFLYNELKVSKNKEDIIKNAQSRYAPALTLSSLKQILDSSMSNYAFIGKPCDIAAINNFKRLYPEYAGRIKYTISIFCAGMPSYKASEKLWEQSGRSDNPVYLKYRGEGWPGNFKAVWKDGDTYEISYNDSWGKVLNRHLAYRCKICPDGIGLLADISVGDSWNTKNGYPDFTDKEGRNFCFIRTERGGELFSSALNAGYIDSRVFNMESVKNMQSYQYSRRHFVGWRIFAANMVTGGLLDFKGLGLTRLALHSDLIRGLKEAFGTLKRAFRIRKEMNGIYNAHHIDKE